MDIQKIEFPKHLLEHNLSDQELTSIPLDKQAMAKDWNKLRRQNEWMMEQIVVTRNLAVAHDSELEFWKRIRWMVVTICGVALTLVSILRQIGVFK